MAISVTNLNALTQQAPAAAIPNPPAQQGLFQATLANAAAVQENQLLNTEQNQTVPLLTYLEDTGQLNQFYQLDYPPQPTQTQPTQTNPTTTNPTTNQTTNSPSLASQLGDLNQSSNVNENGTTSAEYVVEFRFPGLIQRELSALAYPTGSTASTATKAAVNQSAQLSLLAAGATPSGTTEVGTTPGQTPGSPNAQTGPTAQPSTPTTQATEAEATPPIPVPIATGTQNNVNAAAALAAQNQTIPAQVPIVTGLASGQTSTEVALATPEAVAAPVAAAPLPSAQTGERPVMAGDRLAVIAQEGASLQSGQARSAGVFQSVLSQASNGTGTSQSAAGTAAANGAPTRIAATTASLTALSAQPSVSTATAPTIQATPTSSVPIAGVASQAQALGSPLQQVAVAAGNQLHEGMIAAVAAAADQAAVPISTTTNGSAAGLTTLLANAPTPGTTPSAAGPSSPSAVAPTLATQVADGVITHAQALSQNGTTEFRMRLDPPELGPVNVHLVSNGDEVHGHVVVSSESVRQMIESQLPELRQRLEAAGVTVQNFNVSADASGGGNRNAGRESAPETPVPSQMSGSTTSNSTANRFRTNTNTTPRSGQVDVVV